MSTFRLLAPALLACCLAFPAAARAAQPAEQQLVGIWQDNDDPENIIRFFPDHRVRIYVSKHDGEATQLHWIDGHWQLARGRELTMKLNIPPNHGGASFRKFTLKFGKDGLVVKSRGKVVGRQHRITENVLSKHLW